MLALSFDTGKVWKVQPKGLCLEAANVIWSSCLCFRCSADDKFLLLYALLKLK